MSKFLRIVISSALLGILISLSLTAFSIVPSRAAPPPPASGGEMILHYNDNSILARGEEFEETLHPITAQGADFAVNYNPTGDCKTNGLPNFIPTGTITDDWTDEAKAAFDHALSIWSSVLGANQTIVINACWVNPGSTAVLGTGQPVSAYANFTGAPITDTLYAAALANELAGTDLNDADGLDHDNDGNPTDAEITIAFNSNPGITWYFGTDANPPGGQKDFMTAALHEIAHGLGFVSTMAVDTGDNVCDTGNSGDGCWGVGFPGGFPAIYDRFLENNTGQNLIENFANQSPALGTALTTKYVRFNGPNAVDADGGSKPKLFTPNPFELGSSILHLDQMEYEGDPLNHLMIPTAGNPQHDPGPITLGILEDIGWVIISDTVYLPIVLSNIN